MADLATLILNADTKGLKRGENDLKGVSDQARRTASDVDGSARNVSSSFSKIGAAIVAAGLAIPLYDFGKSSIQAAIDAQEMGSAFEVVFGDMSDAVTAWAEETGNALGRSTQELQRSALAFQELFGKALDTAAAAEMSKQFAVLTQDLASFKNLSNEVAQQKLFSGLIGEAEPLRAVGVFLDETTLKARAAAMGLGDFSKELTAQEKIVVRAAEIQAQLAQASGDVERTSGSTANQIKAMNAAVEELQVAMGSKLLPILTPLITSLADVANGLANTVQSASSAGVTFDQLYRIVSTAAVGWGAYRLALLASTVATSAKTAAVISQISTLAAASAQMGFLTSMTAGATVATRTFFGVLAANPFGAIAIAVGVLTASIFQLGQAQRQARAETDNLVRSLKALAQARSTEFFIERKKLETQSANLEKEIARLTKVRDRLGGGRGSVGAGEVSKQLSELVRRRFEIDAGITEANDSYREAEKAAASITVPVAQSAGAFKSLASSAGGAAPSLGRVTDAAKSANDEFERLYDRLRPAEAAYRQLEADRLLIQSRKDLTQAAKDELIALLELEAVRQRTGGFGLAPISQGLLGEGPITAGVDDLKKSIQMIDAEVKAANVLQETGDIAASIQILKDAARDGTQSIKENFKDMAEGVLNALRNLSQSIKSGDFLGILSGVLDLFLQIGATGAFGEKLASNIKGARADGGAVSAGGTYLVGERGPELFSPATNGQIVPNHNMRGNGMVINVDARGSTDPEAVRQQVERGILEAAPAIVAAAQNRTIATLRRPKLAGAL